MKNFAKNYPAIRQVIYGILTLVGAIAVGAGLITESQSAQYLGYGALALTTLGNVLASFFVDRGTSPAQEQKIEAAVTSGIERAAQQAQQAVTYNVSATVDDFADRAEFLRQSYVDPFLRR
ncbi:hypothetical protein ACFYVR_16065 [Rhodococcus sp. NPDC003318]|uniref:hypothetical protein n=1 Tax=Rhodococcus sp. NPDC003318 TaxID=3364503 RepID=UPI0036779C7B